MVPMAAVKTSFSLVALTGEGKNFWGLRQSLIQRKCT